MSSHLLPSAVAPAGDGACFSCLSAPVSRDACAVSICCTCCSRCADKIRSKRDRCKKGSRRYKHPIKAYNRVSQKKRNKPRNCLHKASHLIAHKTVERTIVVGDLSQRQMVAKEHAERKKHLSRAVYNDWLLYTFIQMLIYNSTINILLRFLAQLESHTDDAVQCAEVFTAIEIV